MIEVKLPEMGESVDTAVVSHVLVSAGDVIKADQTILELDSDKASFPLPSPQAGRVASIDVKEGDTVSVGQTIMHLEEGDSTDKDGAEGRAAKREPTKRESEEKEQPQPKSAKRDAKQPETDESQAEEQDERAVKKAPPPRKPSPETTKTREPAPETEHGPSEHKSAKRNGHDKSGDGVAARPVKQAPAPEAGSPVAAGPATRRLARELGVDLHEVAGSETGGRITREDVKTHVHERMGASAPTPASPSLPDFSRYGPCQRERLNAVGRTAADRLSLAWRLIPHVTQHEEADVTELERARVEYNRSAEEDGRPKITMTALAIRAAVAALQAYPHFNSSFDAAAGELIVKQYWHIGVAVDTEHGLMVPVIRDANRRSLLELAIALATLADKARQRALTPKDMEGGTFTISNLGGIGGTAFTPIINYPEVAILGIARLQRRPVLQDGNLTERLLLPLSLSYDHRVINGAAAARFASKLAKLLASPFHLLAHS